MFSDFIPGEFKRLLQEILFHFLFRTPISLHLSRGCIITGNAPLGLWFTHPFSRYISPVFSPRNHTLSLSLSLSLSISGLKPWRHNSLNSTKNLFLEPRWFGWLPQTTNLNNQISDCSRLYRHRKALSPLNYAWFIPNFLLSLTLSTVAALKLLAKEYSIDKPFPQLRNK